MSMVIPKDLQQRIAHELATLPVVMGKVTLTIEMNCGTGGTVSSMKLKKFIEDEVRPC